MAAREYGSLRTYNPWPIIGWCSAAGIVVRFDRVGHHVPERHLVSCRLVVEFIRRHRLHGCDDVRPASRESIADRAADGILGLGNGETGK